MNRLALLALASIPVLFVVAVETPLPASAQTKCGSAVCLGSKDQPLKSSNEYIVTGSNNDGGLTPMHIESGVAVCASGYTPVVFRHTFASIPQCSCVSEGDAGCSLVAAATTTGVLLHGGSSSVLEWMCVGPR